MEWNVGVEEWVGGCIPNVLIDKMSCHSIYCRNYGAWFDLLSPPQSIYLYHNCMPVRTSNKFRIYDGAS